MRIPAAWTMKGRRIKYVLRKLGERSLSRQLLYRRKQEAKAACRDEYPARTITVDVPFEFNLIDLAWRY